MAKIVTLKDNNDGIVYPITPVDGVFVDSNTTLSDALDDKAETDFSNVSNGSIAGNKLNFSTLAFGNYSTAEVDTGFTWIDGKAIYKKTVNCGTLPSTATAKQQAHGISNLGDVIKMEGVAISTTGLYFPLPQMANPSTSSLANGIRIYVNSTDIVLDVGTDRSNMTAYVTIYYTKSS